MSKGLNSSDILIWSTFIYFSLLPTLSTCGRCRARRRLQGIPAHDRLIQRLRSRCHCWRRIGLLIERIAAMPYEAVISDHAYCPDNYCQYDDVTSSAMHPVTKLMPRLTQFMFHDISCSFPLLHLITTGFQYLWLTLPSLVGSLRSICRTVPGTPLSLWKIHWHR